MTIEEMLQLKNGDKVLVDFKVGGNIKTMKCNIHSIFKPKDRNPFAFVSIHNNILGNLLPAKAEQIRKI